MRAAAVAGYFYPKDKKELEALLDKCFSEAKGHAAPADSPAGVAPHAGYIYSGATAATTYLSMKGLKDAETVVIFGPNHSGTGSLVSLSADDWDTPLGAMKNDKEFGEAMRKAAQFVDLDEQAHMFEHSIEVQLPLIRKVNPEAKIVPVCMMDQGLEAAKDSAEAVLAAEKETGRKVAVVASSDFSHYLTPEKAKEKDEAALSFVTGMDEGEFAKRVKDRDWSICGPGPILAAMHYSAAKGCKEGKLLWWTNSGMSSGDMERVVGYASIVFPLG